MSEKYKVDKSASWAVEQLNAVATKENISNKRTDLSNPNNTTYPTTKAVSDAVSNVNEKLSELEPKVNELYGGSITIEPEYDVYNKYPNASSPPGGFSAYKTFCSKVIDISELKKKNAILSISTLLNNSAIRLWVLRDTIYSESSDGTIAYGGFTSDVQQDRIDLSQYQSANYLYVAFDSANDTTRVMASLGKGSGRWTGKKMGIDGR